MNELKDSQPQNPKAAMVEILTEQSDIPAKLGRITQLLHQYRDAEYVKGSAIFVPDAPNPIGVRVPILQAMAGPLRLFTKSDPRAGAQFMRRLWQANTREHKLLAGFMMKSLTSVAPELAEEILGEFLPDLTDWEIVDQLASNLSPLLHADCGKWLGKASQWLRSQQPWIRRLGMVIVVPMCRVKGVAFMKLAEHLEQARGETHPTQLKALGWCWREIGKREPRLVFERLQAWAISKDRTDRRVAWSGSEKCTLEQRSKIRELIDQREKESSKT